MLGRLDRIGNVFDHRNIGGVQTRAAVTDEIGDWVLFDTLDIGLIYAGRTDTKAGRIQTA